MDRASFLRTEAKHQTRARSIQKLLIKSSQNISQGHPNPPTSQSQSAFPSIGGNDIPADFFFTTSAPVATSVAAPLPYTTPIQIAIPEYTYAQEGTSARPDLVNAVPPTGFCCKCHKTLIQCTCFLFKPLEQTNSLPNLHLEEELDSSHVCQQIYLGLPTPREGDIQGTVSVHISGAKARTIETHIDQGKIYCKVHNFASSKKRKHSKE